MGYATTNPFTNEVVARFEDVSDDELERLVQRAQAAFESWRTTSFEERAKVARRAAAIFRERAAELARLLTLEMGKLYRESLDEVELSAQIVDYYAENAEKFLNARHLDAARPSGHDAVVVNEPLGVLLGIQPWNFPYYQVARFAAPNLMAGNVVLVKHASIVPQSAAAFERIYLDAGAPPGVYTNLYATKEQISRLIDDPRIRGVALTGSEAAGAVVAARAGRNLKKTTLELGGSDPLVVLEDADLDKAVEWAVWGRMNNGGQCCVASKRIIVLEGLADAFLQKFEDSLAKLVAGDPFDGKTTLPPMSSQGAADTLNSQVKQAAEHGATVVPLGPPVPSTGAFVQPTVLLDVTRDNPVYEQELFGPVVLFFRAKDEDEAVRIANDSAYGLGGSVFTKDVSHGVEVARRITTGMVFVNHPTWTKPDLPFGGCKRSGYGRELAALGIHEFVNKKLIDVVPIDAPP
jgi:succinate-semialdehyde dehydrogenase / glutarate-semialdehyde dehydrogenase